MATATTTTSNTKTHLNIQTQPTKPKRRRYRETTISSTAHNHKPQPPPPPPPTVVSPDNNSWCCPASKNPPPPPPSPPPPPPRHHSSSASVIVTPSISPSPSNLSSGPPSLRIRYSPGPIPMDSPIPTHAASTYESFPSSFTKFNSALTAGLLNPMSPPPSIDKTRSSPTLFEMMASEPDCNLRPQIPTSNGTVSALKPQIQIPPYDKQALMQQRLSDLLTCRSPGNQFNDPNSSDVKLTLSSKDGFSVLMNVHRQILVAHSRFFADKLSHRWSRQQGTLNSNPYMIEIADCDDIEVYIESIRFMYCKDLRKKLIKEDVSKVLAILKVSAAIGFDAGVLSCLEYLEAAPWAEDEEEKVSSLLSELRLEGIGASEVLKRVSIDNTTRPEDSMDSEGVLLKLLRVVLEGKDEKARREMKTLVLKMLKENSSQNDLRKESLYSACDGCFDLLRDRFLRVASGNLEDVGQIARQADNLHWVLDILIDRQIAEEFLKKWASEFELAEVHSTVAAVHRYEVSRITARLFVGIGKGQLLASKEARCMLLKTWLVPFYDDFGWMIRGSRGLDRHLIEEGLSNTILTLPLPLQQEVLMAWFDRFLNNGENCPNIQRGFEVWWRRAFRRQNGELDR